MRDSFVDNFIDYVISQVTHPDARSCRMAVVREFSLGDEQKKYRIVIQFLTPNGNQHFDVVIDDRLLDKLKDMAENNEHVFYKEGNLSDGY